MAFSPDLALDARPVSEASVDTRARFITRTYTHLLGAIAAFALIEVAIFKLGFAESMARTMIGSQFAWLVVLGAFMLVGWIASSVAHRVSSLPMQYLALGASVVAQSVIFVPLLYIADKFFHGVLQSAVLVTALGFGGLTFVAFTTRKDFSFLGGILRFVGVAALLVIVGGLSFGFNMGMWFSVGMIVFAGAAILYDTSNVLHHYPKDRYVGASLELFASVMLLFWYVIRLLISLKSED